MNKDPLNFGVSGIFGRMGQNPSINALTNANALAQQQMAQQPQQDANAAEMAKLQQEMALKRERMMMELQLEREKMEAELELRRQELAAEAELRAMKAVTDAEISTNLPR